MSTIFDNLSMGLTIEAQPIEVKIKGLKKFRNTIKALEQAQASIENNSSSSADGNTIMTPQQYIEQLELAAAKHFEMAKKANEKIIKIAQEQRKKQKERAKESAIANGLSRYVEYEEKMLKAFEEKEKYNKEDRVQGTTTTGFSPSLEVEVVEEAGPDTIELPPYLMGFRNVVFKPNWMKTRMYPGRISKKMRKAKKIAKEAAEIEKMIIEEGLYMVDGQIYSSKMN